jgi:hypothetical protein
VAIDTATAKLYVSASGGVIAADVPIEDTADNYTATDVEGALSELFTSVSDGKTLIAAAITDKGVSTSATDPFSTMATNIGSISGGGSTGYTIGWDPVLYTQVVITAINKPV